MVAYRISDGCIVIPDHEIALFLLEMIRYEIACFCDETELRCNTSVEQKCEYRRKFASKNGYKQLIIYEDLWFTKGDIIRNRLLANLGLGERIFARKCRVGKISAEMAREFLEINHLIGDARCVFRYGLFYGEELVSVAAFSASRPMERQGRILHSYEWVRYASRASLRIVGGMGKLLDYFVTVERPEEIMSYADIDWSDGDVYRKLGFKQVGETPPVKFYVNSETYERISAKKLLRDRKYRMMDSRPAQDEVQVPILNSGNLKFLKSFSIS